MSFKVWLAFAVLETALCVTPGPAVLFTVSTALTRGARAGVVGALGIVAANTLYFALSALGVAAAVLASYRAFTALKWVGAAYLVWLGVRMLFGRSRPARLGTVRPARWDVSTSAAKGFVVQMANPKAFAFFVALLPQFIDPRAPVGVQVLILGVTSQIIETGVLSSYVWLTGRAGSFAGTRWPALTKRIAGGFLVAAGARLALVRSP